MLVWWWWAPTRRLTPESLAQAQVVGNGFVHRGLGAEIGPIAVFRGNVASGNLVLVSRSSATRKRW
jgi:hypothetical protein